MPGSEFWVGEEGEFGQYLGNAPEIAAVYDRRIAWAEAFTAESYNSAWRNDPWILKRSGDAAFAHGINLFYMHGFVHNPFPDDYQPGLTMGYWGTQLSRHQTWWSYSGPWHQYLARCQNMLQQGNPVFHALRYPAGFDPAEATSNSGPRAFWRMPSAMWERQEFPVQRMRIMRGIRVSQQQPVPGAQVDFWPGSAGMEKSGRQMSLARQSACFNSVWKTSEMAARSQ